MILSLDEYVSVCLYCPAKTPKMNGITMYSEGITNQELSLSQEEKLALWHFSITSVKRKYHTFLAEK